MKEDTHIRDCQASEAALCDYVDGTLTEELRGELEAHIGGCPACAAYLSDIEAGMGMLREAEEVYPPPVLVNRILFQIPAKESGLRGWLGRMFEPIRQPRVVMGAMMTVLSLAMMTRCAGVPNRSLTQADVDPVKIFGAFEDRVERTWDRGVMAYESIRLVYEIRSRVHDWRSQQEELDTANSEAAAGRAAIKAREVPAGSGLGSKVAPVTGSDKARSGNKEVGR